MEKQTRESIDTVERDSLEARKTKLVTEKIKKTYKNLESFFIYTMLFTGIALFLIMIFKKYGKSFIWNGDGLEQHIINLRHFRMLIVNFIRNGSFSTFSWNVGLGIDLFGNFAYYVFGDFFSYLSVLVSTSKVEILYSFLVIVRMYCVGIAFLCYCKYKKMSTFSSVIGALMYTFCSFVLFAAVRHPYFTNAIIIFPLVMLGMEKIVIENKSIFYTIVIAITFVMNFYFAYMIAAIIAIYGMILTIYTYRKEGMKKIIAVLLKVLLYSILGIMISAVILLPTGMEFLSSERTANNGIYPYNIYYYRNFIKSILDVNGVGYWLYWGVQSIVLISLPIFMRRRKENYPMFCLMIILMIPLLFSPIGSMLDGFNYPNNRWTFVMSFIFAYTTVMLLNDIRIEKKDLKAIAIFVLLYLGLNTIFNVNLKFYEEVQIAIGIAILLFMVNKEKLRLHKIWIGLTFVIGILFFINNMYSISGRNYASEFVKNNDLEKAISTSRYGIEDFNSVLQYIKKEDEGFYRISKFPYKFENVSVLKNYNALGGYYSIIPNTNEKLCKDLKNVQYDLNHGVREFDYRTKITTLLGVKYQIKNGNNSMPYGYSLMKDYKGKSQIYQNDYALPFGVLYTKYISEEEYETLSPLEKESSLLKSTVLKEKDIQDRSLTHSQKIDYSKTIKEIPYQLKDDNHIVLEDKITVKNTKNNIIKLNMEEVKNSEIYVAIEGIDYRAFTKEELIKLETNEKSSKFEIEKVKENYKWYQPTYNYTITTKLKNVTKARTVQDYVTSPYYIKEDKMCQ